MNGFSSLVVFSVEEQRYALPLPVVERVVRAAETTALPRAPDVVHGAIDIAGRVLPVLDLRRRLGLPARAIRLTDQFLIARMARRAVVLAIDDAHGVIPYPAEGITASATIAPGLAHIQGVARLEDGLVLIHDLERFLSLDEARALDQAMSDAAAHAHR